MEPLSECVALSRDVARGRMRYLHPPPVATRRMMGRAGGNSPVTEGGEIDRTAEQYRSEKAERTVLRFCIGIPGGREFKSVPLSLKRLRSVPEFYWVKRGDLNGSGVCSEERIEGSIGPVLTDDRMGSFPLRFLLLCAVKLEE